MSKLALITGSGKHRLGNAVAFALAERGYDIALHYNRSAEEAKQSAEDLKKSGHRVEAYQADIADENQVARMFENIEKISAAWMCS